MSSRSDGKVKRETNPLKNESTYKEQSPDHSKILQHKGFFLIEFGVDWCGHCQAGQPVIHAALAQWPAVPHQKVEDGPGRPLGRHFRVKLWPTLILLRDGHEVARVVRPKIDDDLAQILDALRN